MSANHFVLYGYDDNPRTIIVKIVAAAETIGLKQSLVIPRKNINKVSYTAKFPLSQGKIPAIEGHNIMLTETTAICHYLAKLDPKTNLLGSARTLDQESTVLSYISFANQELLQTLARWFLPLLSGFTDPPPYDHDAVEAGKTASLKLLDSLEVVLQGRSWLVGDGVTLADIFIAIVVSRGLQYVLGRAWRLEHPAIMAHFESVREWEPVRSLGHEFTFIGMEMPNMPPRRE